MPIADADLRGQLLDSRYRVEECIGRGGMGIVWRVRHAQTRQQFALKTIRGSMPQSKQVVRRLLHEARATAAVRSAHVVRVVDVEPDYVHEGAQLPYIVMELLEGENLSQFLDRLGATEISELVWVMRQVSQALASAHARGIVHRDLKPSNVFLAREGDDSVVVKVCDFGIAKLQGAAIADLAETGTLSTATGEILGTPRYMAPEQLRRADTEGPATDQWAFALIVFKALTGRNYFESATNVAELVLAIVHEALPTPSLISARFPASLDAWFARSCARDPCARFSSIEQQQAELERCLGTQPPTPIRAADVLPNPATGIRPSANSSGEPRDPDLHVPNASWQLRPMQRLLFYTSLGGAAVVALTGARWVARYSTSPLGVSTEQGRKPAGTSAPRASASTDLHGSHLREPSPVPIAASVDLRPEVLEAGPAKPSIGTVQHRTVRRQTPALLPQGEACSRSTQCASGMCAAEICQ
jgi:serine/threonine-protein kinase